MEIEKKRHIHITIYIFFGSLHWILTTKLFLLWQVLFNKHFGICLENIYVIDKWKITSMYRPRILLDILLSIETYIVDIAFWRKINWIIFRERPSFKKEAMYFTQVKTYFYHAKQKSINFLTCKICIYQFYQNFCLKLQVQIFFFNFHVKFFLFYKIWRPEISLGPLRLPCTNLNKHL